MTLQPIISVDIFFLISYSEYFCSKEVIQEIKNIIYTSISQGDIENYRLATLKKKIANMWSIQIPLFFLKEKMEKNNFNLNILEIIQMKLRDVLKLRLFMEMVMMKRRLR